jgi:hypothetical protein
MTTSTSILSKLQQNIVKHSPTILAVFGGLGAVATAVLASKASIKAKDDLEKAREEKRKAEDNEEADISNSDKAMIYAKAYTPTAIMLGATELCIFGSNHINQSRIAALGAAYILKEADLKEYKDHMEELMGKKKAQEIKDSIISKHVNEADPSGVEKFNPNIPQGLKLDLWWDETSKRYFYSNVEYVRKAEIEANAQLQRTGSVSVNDIYQMLGLETVPLLEDDGWNETHGEIVFDIGATIKEPDLNVWTLTMDAIPSSEWLSIG